MGWCIVTKVGLNFLNRVLKSLIRVKLASGLDAWVWWRVDKVTWGSAETINNKSRARWETWVRVNVKQVSTCTLILVNRSIQTFLWTWNSLNAVWAVWRTAFVLSGWAKKATSVQSIRLTLIARNWVTTCLALWCTF